MSGGIYRLFGLRLFSELALPEVPPDPSSCEPDVTIRLDRLADAPDGPGLQQWNGGVLMHVDGIGRYWIAGGREIRVCPNTAADQRNVRLFLLGSAMGLLLHQRGLLPLHANAVEIEGQALAFMGPSGSGKSTLAAWFHDRGYRLIADDVCVIGWEPGGNPLVQPGLPRFRLWRDAVLQSRRKPDAYPSSYAGDPEYDKFDVPADEDRFARLAVPLGAVCILRQGDEINLERLQGVATVEALIANTYRGEYLNLTGGAVRHWEACVRLAQQVAVFRVSRPWNLEQAQEVNAALLAQVTRAAREADLLQSSGAVGDPGTPS